MHILLFSGLFDQLLNAMNEDSSDDETAGPSVPSGSSGSVRFVEKSIVL